MTLVLALCALQFVYTFPPASYVNVVQQLVIASFVLFGLVAMGCLVVGCIAGIHERKRRQVGITNIGYHVVFNFKNEQLLVSVVAG